MGKLPYFNFYPGDWRRDTQIQMASMETRGVWFELLCCMWDAPERGKLTGTIKDLSQMIGCTVKIFTRSLDEIKRLKIANVKEISACNKNVTTCNRIVTLINRRMYKEEQNRINTKLRVQKHRGKNNL